MSERHHTAGGGGEELRLGRYAAAAERRLARWQAEGFGKRLWQKDPTLWTSDPRTPEIADRLGWLDLPESMRERLPILRQLGEQARTEGILDAVVLGMGGSSLAPEVFARTFERGAGFPRLAVLDSTHPRAVAELADRLDPARTLFVVSSKSGTTTEMLSFFYLFWDRVGRAAAGQPAAAGGSRAAAGRHFVAVTDPGTPLGKLARERGFRALVEAPPDVGGRYSALTPFGLLPAGLAGVDLDDLLARGREMAAACGGEVAAADNPGLRLGAALGELTLAGRDKVTFAATAGLASFPLWLEQLIAESTGKIGRGIVPVAGEPLGPPEAYGDDRFFVGLALGDEDAGLSQRLAALERAGHPVARFRLRAPADLAREMFRWEVAVAAAGAAIGVHPFNQPDVQLAKELAGKAMKELAAAAAGGGGKEAGGAAGTGGGGGRGGESSGSGGSSGGGVVSAADPAALGDALGGWLSGAAPGTYLALQAYLAPTEAHDAALAALQAELSRRTRFATTLGYGPRFLHSTGQLHKGGPPSGRFLQLVDEPAADLPVPETSYTFGTLIRAQAQGDRQALLQRGRRVLRVDLGADAAAGLANLRRQVAALAAPTAPVAGGGA
jgi:transaldolase/glucose-6-phosphate isomerase